MLVLLGLALPDFGRGLLHWGWVMFHIAYARCLCGAACLPRERSARCAARVPRVRVACIFLLVFALTFVLFPVMGFADWTTSTTVERGTDVTGESYIVVSGKPCNSGYYAAARACGYSDNEISRFTAEEKAYASNPATGGSFYVLANSFVLDSDLSPFTQAFKLFLDGLEKIFGTAIYDSIWTYRPVDSTLLAAASRDLVNILDGGTGGGGGSGSTRPDRLSFSDGYVRYLNGTSSYGDRILRITDGDTTISNRVTSSGAARDDVVFSNSVDVVWDINGFIDWSSLPDDVDYEDFYIVFYTRSSNLSGDRPYLADLYYVPDSTSTVTVGSTSFGSLQCNYLDRIVFSGVYYRLLSILCNVTYNNGTFTITQPVPASSPHVFSQTSSSSGLSVGGFACAAGSSHASIGPTVPPVNNWPDPPTTPNPSPPDVPSPTDDPTPQPDPPTLPNPGTDVTVDPYTPDPDPPTNPVITYDPNPTGTAADYRPWLDAILALLRMINTSIRDGFGDLRGYLTEHCDHIREQIHDDVVTLGLKVSNAVNNGFVGFERWLQGTFAGYFIDELDYVIGQQFAELEDYLHSLFQWLASQFDYSFGGSVYDDSSVVNWLRRIYSQLGGASPNPGIGDDPDDGFDWWSWLIGLISDAIGGIVTDLVGDIGGFIAAVAEKFPFSIPADIVAYLTLLDAPRQTPRFVITIPAISGWWASFDFTIDFSPFDTAMATVRSMVLIWWGFVLVMKTDWLGSVFDDAASMVTGFFDRITGGAYSA